MKKKKKIKMNKYLIKLILELKIKIIQRKKMKMTRKKTQKLFLQEKD